MDEVCWKAPDDAAAAQQIQKRSVDLERRTCERAKDLIRSSLEKRGFEGKRLSLSKSFVSCPAVRDAAAGSEKGTKTGQISLW